MKITRVYVELGRKRSINYQSVSIQIGLGADLVDGEDADEIVERLQQQVRELLVKDELGGDGIKRGTKGN